MIRGMAKRDRAVTIRLTSEDLDKMLKAASVAWPGATMPTAAIVASLARMKAQEILAGKAKK